MGNKNLFKLINDRGEFVKTHDFSKYSIDKLEKTLGDHYTIELIDYFENNINTIKWFYSPSPYFNGITPNDYCKINKKEVENEIGRMINSNFI